jgi:hypothetical protein
MSPIPVAGLQRGRRRTASARATPLQPEEPWRATARPPWRPGARDRGAGPRVAYRIAYRGARQASPKLPQGRAFRNAPRGPSIPVSLCGLFRPRGAANARRTRGEREANARRTPRKVPVPLDGAGPRPTRANTVPPDKNYRTRGQTLRYRGAQQGLPGSPTRVAVSRPPRDPQDPHKQAERAAFSAPRNPARDVPGCPTRITGVPDKKGPGARRAAL